MSPHCDTLWSDDVTVKSYDVPKPEEPVVWDEKIEEVESPVSEDPINIEDWDLLYLERGKLKEEFKETYGNLQVTLEELNTIHAKWLLHQYKRIHRLHALGSNNYMATISKTTAEDYQNWLDILSVYSIIHNTTITISSADIEEVDVSDSLQLGVAKFDYQLEWITERASKVFALLQQHARDRENRIVFREQFDNDVSFQVSPSLDGTITISCNRPLDDETVTLSEIPCSASSDGPETKELDALQNEIIEETVLSDFESDVRKTEELPLQHEESEEAESPVPDDPIMKFLYLHMDEELMAQMHGVPLPKKNAWDTPGQIVSLIKEQPKTCEMK